MLALQLREQKAFALSEHCELGRVDTGREPRHEVTVAPAMRFVQAMAACSTSSMMSVPRDSGINATAMTEMTALSAT